MLECLTREEYTVISYLYGLNRRGVHLTRSEVARRLGVKPSVVAQLAAKGLSKLSTPEFRDLLTGGLDQ